MARSNRLGFAVRVGTAVAFALALFTVLAAPAAWASPLAIVGARLYATPQSEPLDDAVVLVDGDRIAKVGLRDKVRIPADARIIDARGKILLAGFWNSHVHILTHALLHADRRTQSELSDALDGMLNRWGFTTVFDVGSILGNTETLRARIRSGEVRGPNIMTVGEPFFPPDGVPIYVRAFLRSEQLTLPETTSIASGLRRERAQIAAGADGVKLFTGDVVGGSIGIKPMDSALATALAREARLRGLPVFAHPTNRMGIEIALASGVTVLAHTADQSGPWDRSLVQRMIAAHMALIPTLTLFEWESDHDNASAETKAAVVKLTGEQLHAFWTAGGEVLFGTDIGYIDNPDTHAEYRLMHAAGMDWRAILASLTLNPARRFSARRKGLVVPGNDADLVLLNADPARDVGALADVAMTIVGGRVIYTAR